MNVFDQRVELLREQYLAGKTFKHVNEIREFLGLPRTRAGTRSAYKADITARNNINADPTTPIVVPAPKVQEENGDWSRRSRGNADHDLERAVVFGDEITTKFKNLSHQLDKVCDKFPDDLDINRLARKWAVVGQQAIELKQRLEQIRADRL